MYPFVATILVSLCLQYVKLHPISLLFISCLRLLQSCHLLQLSELSNSQLKRNTTFSYWYVCITLVHFKWHNTVRPIIITGIQNTVLHISLHSSRQSQWFHQLMGFSIPPCLKQTLYISSCWWRLDLLIGGATYCTRNRREAVVLTRSLSPSLLSTL